MTKLPPKTRRIVEERLPRLPPTKMEIGRHFLEGKSAEELRKMGFNQRTVSDTISLLTKLRPSILAAQVKRFVGEHPEVKIRKEVADGLGRSGSSIEKAFLELGVIEGRNLLPVDSTKFGWMGPLVRKGVKKNRAEAEELRINLDRIPNRMKLADGKILELRNFVSMLARNPNDIALMGLQNGDLKKMLRNPEIRRIVGVGIKRKSILGRAKELLEEKRK